MKKAFTLFLMTVICVSTLLVATSCDLQGNGDGDNDGRNPKINAVYAAYVAYSAEEGETPLSYEEWLLSVRGADGANGLTPYIGENENWWIGDTDTEVPARGKDGIDGEDGKDGIGIDRVELGEDGYLLIYLSDGTVERVKLPEAQTEEHTFGQWIILKDGENCLDRIYFRNCTDCGDTQLKAGEHDLAVTYNSAGHMSACENCNYTTEQSPHTFDASGKCNECGYDKEASGGNSGEGDADGENSYDVYWEQTPIIYELTMEDDGGTFPSGAERYYAGDGTWKTSTARIDVSIRKRNDAAEKASNTKISYKYVQNGSGFDWSASVEEIYKQTSNYTPGSSTDIYSNFVYDLTCASAKGCFANLKSNTEYSESKYGTGKNYFRFNETDYEYESENYFDSYVGEGYFYEYMLSLTLSDDKVYCLGSDYCTDLVRAFCVVPVNIELMNGIDREYLEDMIPFNDVEFTDDMTNIEFFYENVWANQWNFATLLDFSRAVYVDKGVGYEGTGIAGADITDTLGFALPRSGSLASSGILYGSSVNIIEKKLLSASEKAAYLADPEKADFVVGDYLVSYPETNSEMVAFGNALRTLFQAGSNQGVYVADNPSAIRESFVKGKMLFGSIVQLASLEDEDYQYLRTGSGFGIVPVPVYKEGEEYQTLAHSNARIVAIATGTLLYEQCAAYLDYQSRNSSEIIESYYGVQLAQSLRGETSDDNVKMLTYIRNHVRDAALTKTVEEVTNHLVDGNRPGWHWVIQGYGYQVADMQMVYEEKIYWNSQNLKDIIAVWKQLK